MNFHLVGPICIQDIIGSGIFWLTISQTLLAWCYCHVCMLKFLNEKDLQSLFAKGDKFKPSSWIWIRKVLWMIPLLEWK
jgi:hypothetical protein